MLIYTSRRYSTIHQYEQVWQVSPPVGQWSRLPEPAPVPRPATGARTSPRHAVAGHHGKVGALGADGVPIIPIIKLVIVSCHAVYLTKFPQLCHRHEVRRWRGDRSGHPRLVRQPRQIHRDPESHQGQRDDHHWSWGRLRWFPIPVWHHQAEADWRGVRGRWI